MKTLMKIGALCALCGVLSGCIITSAVGAAVDVVDTVTPDIID